MGMTLVEAPSCGTQVVCYDATAMPEIVTDEVGEVVPLGDIAALADAVRRLCAAPRSADACRARAADFEAGKCFPPISSSMKTCTATAPPGKRRLRRRQGKPRPGANDIFQ